MAEPFGTKPVFCDGCAHALRRLDGKDLPAYRWLCMAAPREDVPNYVSRALRLSEPYWRCAVMNQAGDCRRHQPEEKSLAPRS